MLDLPPLRERMQDLAPAAVWIGNRVLRNAGRDYELMTAEEFARASSEDRAAAIELRADAIEALQRHSWPGNFRELEAVLERALMLYRKGQAIGAAEIEAALAIRELTEPERLRQLAICSSFDSFVARLGSPVTLSLPVKNSCIAACMPPSIIERKSASVASIVHWAVPCAPGTQVGGDDRRSTVQVPPSAPSILNR